MSEHELVWKLDPKKEERAASIAHVWTSTCGKYRVHRITTLRNKETLFGVEFWKNNRWESVETTNTAGYSPVYYSSLRRAVEVAEGHFGKVTNKGVSSSNIEALISVAKKLDDAISTEIRAEEKKKEKERKKLDDYGFPLDSKEAKVNRVLTCTPKTMARICEEAGVQGSMYLHMINLKKAGVVEKVEGGYRLRDPG